MSANPTSIPLPSSPPSPSPLRRSHAIRGDRRLSAQSRRRESRTSIASIASINSVATMASIASAHSSYSARSASSAYSDNDEPDGAGNEPEPESRDQERAQQSYEAAYGRLGTLAHPASSASPSDRARVSYHGSANYPIPESIHRHSHAGVHGRVPSSSSTRSAQSAPDREGEAGYDAEPQRRACDTPRGPSTPDRAGSSNVAGIGAGKPQSYYRGELSPTPRYPTSPPRRNQYGPERERHAYESPYGRSPSRVSMPDVAASAVGKRTTYHGLEPRTPPRYQRPRNYTPMPRSRISSSSSARSADWVVPFSVPFIRWPPEVYCCILRHLPLDTAASRETARMLKVEVARSLYQRWVQAPARAGAWRKSQRGPKAWPTFTRSIDRDALDEDPNDGDNWKVDLGTDTLDLEPVQIPCPPEYVTASDNAPRILFLCNLLLELRNLKPDTNGGASAVPGFTNACSARVLDSHELVQLFVTSSIIGHMANVLTATNACFDSGDDVDSGPASIYRALQAVYHIECLYAGMVKFPRPTKSVLETVRHVPPFDLRGGVVWSEVAQLQSNLFALARNSRRSLHGILRATAPLGPRRPLGDPSLSRGDWAGITGNWFCASARGDPPQHLMMWGIATLKVVAEHELPVMVQRGDLYDSQGLSGHSQGSRTSTAFPSHLLSSGLPARRVPPLFFSGRAKRTTENRILTYHIRGLVRLTTDDPPELRFQLVIRSGGRDCRRFDGVQVGGLGSTRGIIGVSSDPHAPETFNVSPREVAPLGIYVSPPPTPQPPRQQVFPMWLWKLD